MLVAQDPIKSNEDGIRTDVKDFAATILVDHSNPNPPAPDPATVPEDVISVEEAIYTTLGLTSMRAQDLKCQECFRPESSDFYCMMGRDLYSGYCCDSELDGITGCKA